MPGDDSLPGSEGSGSVNLGLGLHGLQEGEQQLIADGQQRQAEAGDPDGPLLRPRDQARVSIPRPTTGFSPRVRRLATLRTLISNPLK